MKTRAVTSCMAQKKEQTNRLKQYTNKKSQVAFKVHNTLKH
jgi:hypothetical protein